MRIKTNHTWLFAFTDLAFLLLLSLSLIPSFSGNINVHFSEMDIAVVPSNPNLSPVEHPDEAWELHVYPESKDHPAPFKLIKVRVEQNNATELLSKNLDRNDLIIELESLRTLNVRPMLLPEKTSLSWDFLFAAGAIARVWDSANSRTIVKSINSEELQGE